MRRGIIEKWGVWVDNWLKSGVLCDMGENMDKMGLGIIGLGLLI